MIKFPAGYQKVGLVRSCCRRGLGVGIPLRASFCKANPRIVLGRVGVCLSKEIDLGHRDNSYALEPDAYLSSTADPSSQGLNSLNGSYNLLASI